MPGVRVTVRLDPLPPKRIFALGTIFVFEELAVTTRLVVGVSASPTVKEIGPTAVSSAMV